jgi:hypothetical protein
MSLAKDSRPSRHSDLLTVLEDLSISVLVDATSLQKVQGAVQESPQQSLGNQIHKSIRTHMVHDRRALIDGQYVYRCDRTQLYLKVLNAYNRKATIRLMTGCRKLASHALKYGTGPSDGGEACRMCQAGPEDPSHILELCANPFLAGIRKDFMEAALGIEPSVDVGKGTGWIKGAIELNSQTLVNRTASYIAQILDLSDATEPSPA